MSKIINSSNILLRKGNYFVKKKNYLHQVKSFERRQIFGSWVESRLTGFFVFS